MAPAPTKARKSPTPKTTPATRRAPRPLTPAQESFAQAYVASNNATEAYRQAYPKGSLASAAASGSRMLKTAKVAARVRQLQDELAERHRLSADQVLEELAALGFSDMGRFLEIDATGRAALDFTKLREGDTRAIQEFTQEEVVEGRAESAQRIRRTRVKLHAKTQPLELLGKAIGMFVERHRVDVRDVGELTDEELDAEARKLGLIQ